MHMNKKKFKVSYETKSYQKYWEILGAFLTFQLYFNIPPCISIDVSRKQ